MASRVVSCPNCGGQVEFKAGRSLLAVCPYCSSAVARLGGDVGELEILGRVAPLADLASPLAVGLGGRFGKSAFTLVGRVQYDHGAGPWNEWSAAFDDGRSGWVAEAQGRVYVTFEVPASGLPTWPEVRVGLRVSAGDRALTVVERKAARLVSAEGELPFAAAPGALLRYADLQGGAGVFGTIDYGAGDEPEALYLGRELRYEDLFDPSDLRDAAPGRAVAAVGLNCPRCGAGVELRAPDEARRVTCGSCDALLDCEPGSELHLLVSEMPRIPPPFTPLGSEGALDGARYQLYGQLVKAVVVDGVVYRWTEYLLHSRRGWRWLVESDGHFSFVEPLDAGDVDATRRRGVRCRGQTYLRFASSSARVEGLRGEFYWKVAVGDVVGTTDFVRPPEVVSEERTPEEVTFSLGRYLDRREVERAFALEARLPRPRGIAAHQPNPHGAGLRRMLRSGLALTGLLGLLVLVRAISAAGAIEAERAVELAPAGFGPRARVASGAVEQGAPLAPIEFALDGPTNVELRAHADVDYGYVYLGGTLTNRTTGVTQPVGVLVDWYGGFSSEGAWRAPGRAGVVRLGEVGSGTYELRLVPEWSAIGSEPTAAEIRVVSDVFIAAHGIWAAALLWVLPLWGVVRYFLFEKRRWSESDLSE